MHGPFGLHVFLHSLDGLGHVDTTSFKIKVAWVFEMELMQCQSVHDRRWWNEVQSRTELNPGLPEAGVGSRKVLVARNSNATVS